MKARTFRFSLEGLGPDRFRSAEDVMAGIAADAKPPVARMRLHRQDPAMHRRDEMIFLLHTAAEIEHSLLVQYLYAAYSLPTTNPQRAWRSTLTQIAREEMGHLLSIQNVLLAFGAPLNFDREDYPYNTFYPFPFELRPLSVQSVARYVLAEMPDRSEIPPELQFDYDIVAEDADVDSPEQVVNRVGALFDLLAELAVDLSDADVVPASESYQADPVNWRAGPFSLVLGKVKSLRDITGLLNQIGEQGEGPTEPPDGSPSHFLRLWSIYQEAKALAETQPDQQLAKAVPVAPTVHYPDAPGYLSNPEANAWGDVFNHRYRWLLAQVGHALQLDFGQDRNQLRIWAFDEMTTLLPRLADFISAQPQHAPGGATGLLAGAPFELPYTLALPSRSVDLWRHHQMLTEHSLQQMQRMNDGILKTLIQTVDQRRLQVVQEAIGRLQ